MVRRPVVDQRITGLAFHEQGHELANLRDVETGIQGLDNTSDVGGGAIGVVGPARMNYGKIIPLVDYTAKLVSQLLS